MVAVAGAFTGTDDDAVLCVTPGPLDPVVDYNILLTKHLKIN